MNDTTQQLSLGDPLPNVQLAVWRQGETRQISVSEYFAGKRAVLFAVPGAFTPTCSDVHLPGFLARADDLQSAGLDEIVCTAVNDVHVMAAWAETTGAAPHMTMLVDGSGHLAQALGLSLDLGPFGMGLRSQRYAAVVDDGRVIYLGIEPGREVGVSGAEAVLSFLREQD